MTIADYIGRYWAGAEVMYGIIIAMTFTCMLWGHPENHGYVLSKIILAALLCCAAWGLADGFFYVWERNYLLNRENRMIALSQSGSGSDTVRSLLGEELDDTILRAIRPENRSRIYDDLIGYLSTAETRGQLDGRDALSILLGTFLLSAGGGFIVVLPFFFIDNTHQALALSNLAGILLLFHVGYSRASGRPALTRLRYGFATSCIGVIIAGITIALSG